MKFKKVLILFFIFLGLFMVNCYATEFVDDVDMTVDIDITKIAENFNRSSYVSKLSSIGISVSAVQTNNSIILRYNNSNSITYSYDAGTGIFTTTYPISDTNDYLNAIFIDTIYTMQGNLEGQELPFVLDDTLCFSGIRENGIEKTYVSGTSGNILIKFQINPSKKLMLSTNASSIMDYSFLDNGTIYSTEDFSAKSGNIIFYKTYNSDGLLELYIGQPDELNSFSYDSILTSLSIIFGDGSNPSKTVMAYLKQNYVDFSVGNSEFGGISIDTSIEALPVQNGDTILVAPNMKYAKFTIDVDKVNEELPNVVVDEANVGDSSKISKNRLSAPLVISIVIIASVLIIMLAGILIRRNQNL